MLMWREISWVDGFLIQECGKTNINVVFIRSQCENISIYKYQLQNKSDLDSKFPFYKRIQGGPKTLKISFVYFEPL